MFCETERAEYGIRTALVCTGKTAHTIIEERNFHMQALFLVLNKVECLEELLVRLAESGVKGGTVIESTGMARILGDAEDFNILGTLRQLMDPSRVESKTLFFVLKDEQIQKTREIIDEVTGGLEKPNTGIMFGVKLSFVEGIGE